MKSKVKFYIRSCFLVITFSILGFCKNKDSKQDVASYETVILNEYAGGNNFIIDSIHFREINKNSSVINLFHPINEVENGEILELPIRVNKDNYDKIYSGLIELPLVGEKKYSFKGNEYLVRKYYYNIQGEEDEDGFYFLIESRVIGYSSNAWNIQRVFKYENLDFTNALLTDSSEFFNERLKLKMKE